ncbi:protein kinase [Cryptosporidium felis]|nr:protein kinase [Cryptosporidium felis]
MRQPPEIDKENSTEIDNSLTLGRIDKISAHEQVLATKYLSRYKSFYGRLHSPTNSGPQIKRGLFVYLDEELGAKKEEGFNRSKLKACGVDNKGLGSIVKLKERLFDIKDKISPSSNYEHFENCKMELDKILKESEEIGLLRNELKDNEQTLTRKLALVKNSFKTSIVQYKKIERELNRSQFFWQESQIGLAPALNSTMRKKRQALQEQVKEPSKKRQQTSSPSRNSENEEPIRFSKEKSEITRSITLSKRSSSNSENVLDSNLKELPRSEVEASIITSSEVAHYNTLASCNSFGDFYQEENDREAVEEGIVNASGNNDNDNYSQNINLNHRNQISLPQIDEEAYRDGLNFQNLLNFRNNLQGFFQHTPYHILGTVQVLSEKHQTELERTVESILIKRRGYASEFAKKLEWAGVDLDIERSLYIKKSRLFRHQQNSRYNNLSTLSSSQAYTLLNMIGKGGFAEVWEVLNMNTWSITAAKIHELTSDMTEHERIVCVERVSNEIKLHRDLKHPNIVNMLHCFEVDNDRLVTIMELCHGPDLDTFIKANGSIPEKLAIIWIRQILEGILYLNNLDKNGNQISPQRSPIIHYDLKPGNIILHRGCCKIADFGLSKLADQVSGNVVIERIGGGTVWYQPPEILLRPGDSIDNPRIISHKVDIWAIGCIFFEILHLKRPFGLGSNSIAEAFSLIPLEAKKGAAFGSHVSQECRSYINWLLTYDQEQRPGILEAYSHPLIQGVV